MPNIADSNYRKLAALFPSAVTETIDPVTGETVRAIDKDVLEQEISCRVVEGGAQRYQFTWPDKRKAVLAANAPINATLRPVRADSVSKDGTPGGFDSSNLYIEGNNLDVLKLLQETYLGRVKMIYIDPPYNTGNDFIYEDNFTEDTTGYLGRSGQFDDQGNQLVTNPESKGRFHTDWLNMIYPRLKLARNLLSDDGVIFISIDDNEQENLKKICDEIFGEFSFVTTIHVQLSTTQGMKVKAAKDGNIVKNAEYILCYSKDGHKNIARQPLYDLRDKYDEHYSLILKNDGTIGQLRDLYDYRFPHDCHNTRPYKLSEAYKYSQEFVDIVHKHLDEIVCTDKVTGFAPTEGLSAGRWKEYESNGKKYLLTLASKGNARQLLKLSDSWGKTDGFYGEEGLRKIRGDWWEGFYIDMGNVSKEGGVAFDNGKKPVRLIYQLAKMVTTDDDIIMDFFSGSATTAHAVMQLNVEDAISTPPPQNCGHRRFIMVQLPEACEPDSEAYKAGFANICEIGKERIRRAAKKIRENAGMTLPPDFDGGFRCLRLDSSNMKDVYYAPEDTTQDMVKQLEGNIKPDRSPEDLLFQVMLEKGIPLSSEIKETEIDGKRVFDVADGYLLACFDEGVTTETVATIAQRQPYYAVFRDSSFADDSIQTNFDQIFETYSPSTDRRVL